MGRSAASAPGQARATLALVVTGLVLLSPAAAAERAAVEDGARSRLSLLLSPATAGERPGEGAIAAARPLAAVAPDPRPRGTYRMRGAGRLTARPVLSRSFELRADAILRLGPSPRSVLVSVSAEGATCEIEATLEDGGALSFRPGQACAVDLRTSDTRAHVDARLRTGSGRVEARELALELAWDLTGAVSFRAGRKVEVGGTSVDLPPVWSPQVPVRGEAQGSATGTLDASRAAEPVR